MLWDHRHEDGLTFSLFDGQERTHGYNFGDESRNGSIYVTSVSYFLLHFRKGMGKWVYVLRRQGDLSRVKRGVSVLDRERPGGGDPVTW